MSTLINKRHHTAHTQGGPPYIVPAITAADLLVVVMADADVADDSFDVGRAKAARQWEQCANWLSVGHLIVK